MTDQQDITNEIEACLSLVAENRLDEAVPRLRAVVEDALADGGPAAAAGVLLASLLRTLGDAAGAADIAERTLKAVDPGSPAAAGAHRELGQARLALGDEAGAAEALSRAAEPKARQARPAGGLLAELALAGLQATVDQAGAEERLARLLGVGRDTLLDAARAADPMWLAWAAGATAALAQHSELVERGQSTPAEDAFAASIRALLDGDTPRALAAVRRARAEARVGGQVNLYVIASCSEAELADAVGDRPAAYAALAVGWRSLDTWIGRPAGRRAFEAATASLIERWGRGSFDSARDAYLASLRSASA